MPHPSHSNPTKPALDLTGRRFGKLVAVKRVGSMDWGNKKNSAWCCACDCGRVEVLPVNRLRHRPTITVGNSVDACERCRHTRVCAVCERTFLNPTPKSCCSAACSLINKRRKNLSSSRRRVTLEQHDGLRSATATAKRARVRQSAPTPTEIRAAREAAGLTQPAAAAMVHTSPSVWAQWEAEILSGKHKAMHAAFWELFRLKLAAKSDSVRDPRGQEKPYGNAEQAVVSRECADIFYNAGFM